MVPRSACVSEDDEVILDENGAGVVCENGAARILPIYTAVERASVGSLELELVIKEITEPEEFEAYEALTRFHYRGHSLFGRTARLVVRNFHPIYPQVIGYIELTTPFYMNKARATLFDAPFKANGVSWNRWDTEVQRRYIHLNVRIARCVVYPEFRGLGIGKMLIEHAANFARDRWQVSRLKPYFMEISADMLKYVPFAQKGGMSFVGETEGNLKRGPKDISYLLRNKERIKAGEVVRRGVFGVLDKQVTRLGAAEALMERHGWTLDQLTEKLQKYSEAETLRDFDLLREILSLPKPTYLRGLNGEAEEFVRRRVAEVAPRNGHAPSALRVEPLDSPVELRDVSVTFGSRVRRTWHTHDIERAFGISSKDISHEVVHELSLDLGAGEVVLLTGPSGAGKTTLLRLLSNLGRDPSSEELGVAGSVSLPENYRPGVFASIRSKKPLIEVAGGKNTKETLHLMGLVGLSDALIYLKRFNELSNGQQYRVMLARLIASGCNVWFADEFCANLDAVSANVVADRLQRVARELGATLVVASSQPENFAASLKPDRVLRLTTAREHSVTEGTEFLRALPRRGKATFGPSRLPVAQEYISDVRAGRKHSTIRKGRIEVKKGLFLLTARGGGLELVNVLASRRTRLNCVTEEEARRDGFGSLDEWRAAMSRHYSKITDTTWVTVVEFEPVGGLRSSFEEYVADNGR